MILRKPNALENMCVLSCSGAIGDNLKMVQKRKGNRDPYLTDEDVKNIEYHDNEIAEKFWGNNNDNPDPKKNGNGTGGNDKGNGKDNDKDKLRSVAEKLVDLISQNSNIFFRDNMILHMLGYITQTTMRLSELRAASSSVILSDYIMKVKIRLQTPKP